MKNRISLLVGSVIFAVLIVRIAIPGTEPGEGGTLQAAALIGGGLGALTTLVALRLRLRVPTVHLLVLTPLLALAAASLVVEDAHRPWTAIGDLVASLRAALEVGNLLLEDVIVFGVAFWVIAAFFVHATVEGSPRIAVLAPLVAALAVTVLEPPPTSLARILVDVALVAAVLVAAALDERSGSRARFVSVARRRRPTGGASGALPLVAAITTLLAAIGVAAGIAVAVPDQQVGFAPALRGETVVYRPFVDVHQRLTEIRDEELFTIEFASAGHAGQYVRLFTLPGFDGSAFVTGPGGEQTPGPGRVEQRIEVTGPLGGTWLPAVSGVHSVVDAASTIVAGGVRGTVQPGMEYAVVSSGPSIVADVPGLVAPPAPETLRLDGMDRAAEITKAASSIAGGGTALERATALERHFRSGTYRLPDSPQTTSIAGWLLDEEDPLYLTGYCQQFAVGMAVAARSIGLPGRVVVGFAPGLVRESTTTYTGAEAHAWVEVWLAGSGWVMFDPTPRGGVSAFGPDYEQFVAEPTVPPPPTGVDSTPTSIVAAAPGDGRSPELSPIVMAGLVLVALLALLSAGTAFDRAQERHRASAGDVMAAWDVIVRRLGDLGRAPDASATPLEIADVTGPELEPLARTYTKTVYGSAPIAQTERDEAVRSMTATERALHHEATLLERLIAATGLGGLRRRAGR